VTRNILVIDDDPDLRETLVLLLADHAVTVTAVGSGREGLAVLADGSPPDLILLDLMMPEMNGWQFLEHLRSDAALGAGSEEYLAVFHWDNWGQTPIKLIERISHHGIEQCTD